MIYQSDRITYCPVMEAFHGTVNDVLICRNADTDRNSFYTLLVLKDHEAVKKLIRMMKTSPRGSDCCLDFFQYQNQYCMAFPQVKERKLADFYMASQFSLNRCMDICKNLVLQCMLSGLPYPLLYLVLKQEQIHLLKDYNIELGYTLNLAELDESIGEKECTAECAEIIRKLLQPKKNRRNIGYQLLTKKLPREGYQTLQELYRDLRAAEKAGTRQPLLGRIKIWWNDEQGRFFRMLLIVCVVLLLFTGVCFLSKLVFGDIPFLRILFNHFKIIGTESLVS